jgi:hypothetical protein
MAIVSSGPLSLGDIGDEKGYPRTNLSLEELSTTDLNTSDTSPKVPANTSLIPFNRPDAIVSHRVSEFYAYKHLAAGITTTTTTLAPTTTSTSTTTTAAPTTTTTTAAPTTTSTTTLAPTTTSTTTAGPTTTTTLPPGATTTTTTLSPTTTSTTSTTTSTTSTTSTTTIPPTTTSTTSTTSTSTTTLPPTSTTTTGACIELYTLTAPSAININTGFATIAEACAANDAAMVTIFYNGTNYFTNVGCTSTFTGTGFYHVDGPTNGWVEYSGGVLLNSDICAATTTTSTSTTTTTTLFCDATETITLYLSTGEDCAADFGSPLTFYSNSGTIAEGNLVFTSASCVGPVTGTYTDGSNRITISGGTITTVTPCSG